MHGGGNCSGDFPHIPASNELHRTCLSEIYRPNCLHGSSKFYQPFFLPHLLQLCYISDFVILMIAGCLHAKATLQYYVISCLLGIPLPSLTSLLLHVAYSIRMTCAVFYHIEVILGHGWSILQSIHVAGAKNGSYIALLLRSMLALPWCSFGT